MNAKTLLSIILQCGADYAAQIRQEQIVLSKQFREICEKTSAACLAAAGSAHRMRGISVS